MGSMKKEHIRKLKKTLSSKLNHGSVIKATMGGIVNWTKTKKLLTIRVLTKKRKKAWTNCSVVLRTP